MTLTDRRERAEALIRRAEAAARTIKTGRGLTTWERGARRLDGIDADLEKLAGALADLAGGIVELMFEPELVPRASADGQPDELPSVESVRRMADVDPPPSAFSDGRLL